jgi:hypothetical protein
MIKLLAPFFIILLVSCSADVKLVDEDNNYFIDGLDLEVKKYKEIPWKVGVDKEQTITMGLALITDVPLMSSDDYQKLEAKHGVDSWIYQFIKRNNGKNTVLGYASIPLRRVTRSLDNFTSFIFYSAAAASTSYRSFRCPAFGHNKKVNKFFLNYLSKDKPKVYLGMRDVIRADVGGLDSFPLDFDGGDSLVGDYFVRVALWNSTNKRTYSRWFIVDGVVSIESEQPTFIKSCVGINEEINPLTKGGIDLQEMNLDD